MLFILNVQKEAEARAMGATGFLLSTAEDFLKVNARSFDTVLNTTSAEVDYNGYFQLVKPYGNFILLGAAPCEMKVTPMTFIFAGVKIWGSLIGSPKDFEDMFELASKHNIGCQIEQLPLADVNKALEKVEKNQVRYRCVLTMPEDQ
jgi:D-arabinose 1-dehydrogenase-like Zn-dependent alcohol dehydrogenase